MARINKELVAMNLLTCPTSKEAAEKSGISVPTLYRLKKDTAFQSVLQKVKDNIFGETMHKAQGYACRIEQHSAEDRRNGGKR